MPSLVGSVNINTNSGVINFGDALNISPNETSKTVSGQGGSNTGNVVLTWNGVNVNNTSDPDVVDSSAASGTAVT